jgi:hypothetical protein
MGNALVVGVVEKIADSIISKLNIWPTFDPHLS